MSRNEDEEEKRFQADAKAAQTLYNDIISKYRNKKLAKLLEEECFDDTTIIRSTVLASIWEGEVEDSDLNKAPTDKFLIEAKTTAMKNWMFIREYIRREDPKILALIRSRHD